MGAHALLMPRIHTILFDLDGTLIDSARLTGAIIAQMLSERGVAKQPDIQTVRDMDGIGGEAMIAAVMGEHCLDPAREIAEFRLRHAVANTPSDLPFQGVRAGLEALSAGGIQLGICSNKPQHLCEKILGDLGLLRLFAVIVGSRPDQPRKPSPVPAYTALAAMQADASRTIYVGDSLIDVQTAQAAGLDLALVEWGYGFAAARAAAPEALILQAPQSEDADLFASLMAEFETRA